MKKLLPLILLTVVTTNAIATGQSLYKNCAGCHGDTGTTKALQLSKPISGQEKDKTIVQLTAYKNGELNKYGLGNIMKMQVATLSDGDIKSLAEYIATLK
jgi:cytochrome c553